MTIYVDPTTGSDSNAGTTTATALKTIARALLVAAAIGSGTTVSLRAGTHALSQTMALTSAHNGLSFTAYPGEAPIISGGVALTGWTLVSGSIYKAAIPAGTKPRAIYVNGVRRFRTFAADTPPAGTSVTSTGYSFSGSMPTWASGQLAAQTECRHQQQWVESCCGISSIGASTITMAPGGWAMRDKKQQVVPESDGGLVTEGGWTHVENVYELLAAGTCCFDYTGGYVYYWPAAGENLATATVIAPVLEQLVTVTNATKISFAGIQFSHTTWLQPFASEAFMEIQAGVRVSGGTVNGRVPFVGMSGMTAAITVSGSSKITFERCPLKGLGGAGIAFLTGSSKCSYNGAELTDISGNGAVIGGVTDWQADNPASDCVVSNVWAHDFPVEFRGSVPLKINQAQRSGFKNFIVDNCPYSATSAGLGWHNVYVYPNASADNFFIDGIIRRALQTLMDGGSLYSNGPQRGLKLLRIYIENQNMTGNPFVLYLDNGADRTLGQNVVVSNGGQGAYRAQDDYGGNKLSRWFLDYLSSVSLNVNNGSQPTTHVTSTAENFVGVSDPTLYPVYVLSRVGLTDAYRSIAPDSAMATVLNPTGAKQSNNPTWSAVQNLAATRDNSGVHLSWSAPATGANFIYEIRSIGRALDGNDLVIHTRRETANLITDILPGQSYTYAVRCVGPILQTGPDATITVSVPSGATVPTPSFIQS